MHNDKDETTIHAKIVVYSAPYMTGPLIIIFKSVDTEPWSGLEALYRT